MLATMCIRKRDAFDDGVVGFGSPRCEGHPLRFNLQQFGDLLTAGFHHGGDGTPAIVNGFGIRVVNGVKILQRFKHLGVNRGAGDVIEINRTRVGHFGHSP